MNSEEIAEGLNRQLSRGGSNSSERHSKLSAGLTEAENERKAIKQDKAEQEQNEQDKTEQQDK